MSQNNGRPDQDRADLSGCSDLRGACQAAYLHYIRAGPYPVQELLDAELLKRRSGELATTQLGHDLFAIGVI